MLRLARQTLVLEDETLAALGRGDGGRVPLRVALNADSLDTWWEPVLREAATWDDVVLQMQSEDQEHTAVLLRDGAVVAAVTDDPTPVAGCTSTPLGTMRYHAVCASFLLELHRDARGRVDFGTLPIVDYGPRDGLQHTVLRRVTRGRPVADPPTHLVPSVHAYLRAVELGLGWGMLPSVQIPPGVLEGRHPDLEPIPALGAADVHLHWQRWTAGTAALDRLTDAVLRAAPSAGDTAD